MKHITFPKSEHDGIMSRLAEGKPVYTVRVSSECGKYAERDVLRTEWSSLVRVVSVKKITGGIRALEEEYIHFPELAQDMLSELTAHEDMEIILLEPMI